MKFVSQVVVQIEAGIDDVHLIDGENWIPCLVRFFWNETVGIDGD
jgi:hypothetical protein